MRAYVNVCLHRGTQLRASGGSVKAFRCPFHGWTWDLDGKLTDHRGTWDFPQVDRAKACLPEAKVGVWGGFVFINFDPDCEPLQFYLEALPEHFERFALEDRYKGSARRQDHAPQRETGDGGLHRELPRLQAHPQVRG